MKQHGFLFIVALCLPFSVSAKTQSVWEFSRTADLSQWQGEGIGAFNQTADGLIVKTDGQAHITRPTTFTHKIEEVRLRYRSEVRAQAKLLWHVRGTPENVLIELPFTLERSIQPTEILLPVETYNQWDPTTDRIGLMLPSGVKVELQQMTFLEYGLFDRLLIGVQSLFKMDTYRASIPNFLWGPHIAGTVAAKNHLFDLGPPRSLSVNVILYFLLGIALAWILLKVHRKTLKPHIATVSFLLCISAVWVAYDLRMGAEFLSYAWADAQDYWLEEPGKRTFREREDYNDFIAQITPRLSKHAYYALVVPREQPLAAIMRYSAYPALPVRIEEADARVTAGVFYREPGISLTELSQLKQRETLLSPPGTITYRSAPHTFLFEVTP